MLQADRNIQSTCPYCGVGCQIDLHIKDDHIFRVEAPFDTAPNYGRLCVKGRFGMDFTSHPDRLTQPLIRKNIDQGPRKPIGPEGFRTASWDEALELATEKITSIASKHGGDAIGTFCCGWAIDRAWLIGHV